MTGPNGTGLTGATARGTGTGAGIRSRAAASGGALLAVLAAVAVLAGAPVPVRTGCAGLAAVAVLAPLARRRGRGAADAVLVAVGGLLVVLVVLGLLLGVLGVGLTPRSWALGLAVLAVGGLAAGHRTAHPAAPAADGDGDGGEDGDGGADDDVDGASRDERGAAIRRAAPWGAAALAVSVAAVAISVHAADSSAVQPVQMSVGRLGANGAEVTLSSDQGTGALELRTQVGGQAGVSYPLLRLRPHVAQHIPIAIPPHGRVVVTLNNLDQNEPLRS